MRRFTFSRPWWSASSVARTAARSRLSSLAFVQGRSRIQSRYVRTIGYSGDAAFIPRSLFNCFGGDLRGLFGELRLGDPLLELVELGLRIVVRRRRARP